MPPALPVMIGAVIRGIVSDTPTGAVVTAGAAVSSYALATPVDQPERVTCRRVRQASIARRIDGTCPQVRSPVIHCVIVAARTNAPRPSGRQTTRACAGVSGNPFGAM